MSYVMESGDTIESLASRFGVSMDNIEKVNGIVNPNNVTAGSLFYIPLDSVPGDAYPINVDLPVAPVPAPLSDIFSENQVIHKAHAPYIWIVGSLGLVLALIVIGIVIYVSLRPSICCTEARRGQSKDSEGKSSYRFHILRKPSFCCGSGRYISGKSGEYKQPNGEPKSHPITIPKALGTNVFEVEKPVVFTYEEIHSSTDGFSDSNLLGNGTYGSVYYSLLRDQEVAIKRMTATKTKEFLAEMKVLCKVHHTNLVELIGYAATNDELFLIYEYAQKGSLRNHLHDLQSNVQIALDAARGLEYIHEHTKTHYVHRDIKTSNILLDGTFRAKISDFGLAKLVGITNEGKPQQQKLLLQNYIWKEATIRTEGMSNKNPERRSLVSIMLGALKNAPDSVSMANMKDYIDPNMMDCIRMIMAMLAKQCVDDDPMYRPDMKQVVISLSQILLSSVEWKQLLPGQAKYLVACPRKIMESSLVLSEKERTVHSFSDADLAGEIAEPRFFLVARC
ncbi:hypothetical protein F8388_006119 [Cannabis sativa]|uniref:Uncharacterized protein n=1 Tax=Cannabis sativa TaxID=3483 RepID=A0A7J6G730_CANSA|nr:hypothetical protein F8388_006119 [Cannabis sativa]